MLITLPNLRADFGDGGADEEIALFQDFAGNEAMVTLHRSQLQLLAERAGLLKKGEPGSPFPPATTLARRLRVLRDRIDRLDDWLRAVAENGREDLEDELTFSFATWEIACEFCADLQVESDSTRLAPAAPSSHPKSGGATPANDPERGGVQGDLLSAIDGKGDGGAMANATTGGSR